MGSKITTKRGDNGTSTLFSGEVLSKNSLEFEVAGTIDELVSHLGVARVFSSNEMVKIELEQTQRDLFVLASEVCTTESKREKIKTIDDKFMSQFEKRREQLENLIEYPKDFILPGGEDSKAGAFIDVARTVCRRCERLMAIFCFPKFAGSLCGDPIFTREGRTVLLPNKNVFVYINRLSDYLWLLGRLEEGKHKMQKPDSQLETK